MMHKPPPDGGDKFTSTCDFVEESQYLYVRVVKAKDLQAKDVTGSCDPYVVARVGQYKSITRHFEKQTKPEWQTVFAFTRDRIRLMTTLEITVNDKDIVKDDFMGWVLFDLTEIPERVPPDSPLAPQWYRLVDRKGEKLKGELMLAVWWGTQADEAFPEAYLDVAEAYGLASIHSKVYFLPRLWYLRVNVIEVQDLIPGDSIRSPEIFVKATLGNQTAISKIKSVNPFWNEELMFVAAEPFEDHLILSVEDRVAPNKDEFLGMCLIPLRYVDRRLDDRTIRSRWFNLQKDVNVGGQDTKQAKFSGRIHLSICLEGGYHVLHEPDDYISDFRPAAKQLWKKSIGFIELRILSAHGLSPMKTKDGIPTTDAYCVAKYGTKWVRTKTKINTFTPKWDEQYTWEVYDPCTVLTIGVFDNFHLQGVGGDTKIGKVRIRVSTLEANRIYNHSYPLFILHPSGVKKMGEINLAIRFTCSSLLNTMYMYSQPLLPAMHYIHPLTVTQLDTLRHHATQTVSMRLSQDDLPFRNDIVEYMLDVGCDSRQRKASFLRIKGIFGGLVAVGNWFSEMYSWKNPVVTIAIHILFFIFAMYPSFIFSSLFVIGVWNYRHKPMHPPDIDLRLVRADNTHRDELDEEVDTFQRVFVDIATQGERLQSLLSWRDPIATSLFVIFCLIAAIVLYAVPFYVVVIQTVVYVLNHLSFQNKLPSVPVNFFRRLPDRTDSML